MAGKKREREKEAGGKRTKDAQGGAEDAGGEDTPMLTVAFPASILETQHKPILQSYLVGQVARALAVCRVGEVVVFNETTWGDYGEPPAEELFAGKVGHESPVAFIARLLLLAECPQYLRKHLFPLHPDTRDAGVLPPLMTPHHPGAEDYVSYREGMVLDKGTEAEAGLWAPVRLPRRLPANMRVTLEMDYSSDPPRGIPVSPSEPPEYRGYTVRTATALSDVLDRSRYDLILGTSERGRSCYDPSFALPKHTRPLLVLGGPKGLEECIKGDPKLKGKSPQDIFDDWVNVCPNQGSRTIRTEEALLITMTALRGKLRW